MAYIPPHMRHSKDPQRPSPVPEMLVPKFNGNLNLGSPNNNADMSGKIVYADRAISRWFAVGLDEDGSLPSSVHLEPFLVDAVEHKRGAKPLVLVNNNLAKDNDKVCGNISRSTWESVAENVWPDVLSACKIVKNEMEENPTLVARFGHVLFRRNNFLSLENVREEDLVAETALRQFKRSFYTNVPATYMEKIINEVVPKIGVDFEGYKDIYHVKLSDSERQNSTVSCKCTVKENNKLELYKVELNPVRHMVVDISCLDKNLDLRLALCTKSTLSALSDDEMNCIRNLINSAILDPEVKGGLRWPMGKSYSGQRYRVIGVWHTEFKSYKSPSLKLKVRNADRFDFKTATGEATIEINLKLRRIVSKIQCEVNIITMAYIPPHLRRSKDPQRPSPVPEMLEPILKRKLKLGSSKHDTGAYSNGIKYGDHAVHRKLVCGLDNNNSISSDHFEEFPGEPDEHKRSMTINLARDNDIACANTSRSPWESIAENVWPDVLSACNIVKNEMEEKPKMCARFGNILFDENDLPSLESATERQVAETVLKPLRRCFNTPVPAAYVEKIVHEVVPKIGVDFVECKDIYNVKLYDGTRHITCKCTVNEDQKLELYKVVLDQVRHMVADIVCFGENLDLRLALYTRSTLSALPDDEMNGIRVLINSAIPDPEVKGGLRWPTRKPHSGEYTVIGVWRTEIKSYKSPSLKLKVENVDRLIVESATGWKTIEIHLKWRRIVSEIQGGEIDTDSIYNGFKEQLRLIWDHFLSTDCKLSCLSPNLSPHSYMRLCASSTCTSRNM
ncbi:uncharacterized protein LOC102624505 isoform X8 [Citrus sinensis]|uniref:uncharacterized protein LOC102624505 isoform X8 n=1 Tax=Citrus sinensis TaxID=2711 RepID=UPI0022787591|nr:uncharacterized protein LOC102624505 isoform X8 [Citrus sinensis]